MYLWFLHLLTSDQTSRQYAGSGTLEANCTSTLLADQFFSRDGQVHGLRGHKNINRLLKNSSFPFLIFARAMTSLNYAYSEFPSQDPCVDLEVPSGMSTKE